MEQQITQAQCKAVIQNQCALNAKVNPDWINANYSFHRAIWTEAGEALEYLPWEWWKRKAGITPEITPQQMAHVRLELIDILHFGISLMLVEAKASALENNVVALARQLLSDTGYEYQRLRELHNEPHWNTDELITAIENIAGNAAYFGGFEFITLARACFFAGMTESQILALYNGKNALNVFRQQNGYKEGSYIKNWRTKDEDAEKVEDNEVLHSLVTGHLAPTEIEGIAELLRGYYIAVVRYAQSQKRAPKQAQAEA